MFSDEPDDWETLRREDKYWAGDHHRSAEGTMTMTDLFLNAL